jgi:hypothetical protein
MLLWKELFDFFRSAKAGILLVLVCLMNLPSFPQLESYIFPFLTFFWMSACVTLRSSLSLFENFIINPQVPLLSDSRGFLPPSLETFSLLIKKKVHEELKRVRSLSPSSSYTTTLHDSWSTVPWSWFDPHSCWLRICFHKDSSTSYFQMKFKVRYS